MSDILYRDARVGQTLNLMTDKKESIVGEILRIEPRKYVVAVFTSVGEWYGYPDRKLGTIVP